MSKDSSKITYKRLIYYIIDFFGKKSQLSFDVSTYIKNENFKDCKFGCSKISKFIQRNRKRESNNRFFLTISFNASGTIADGRALLNSMINELVDEFLSSSVIEMLYNIDSSAFVELISSKENSSMTDYIIIIFNILNCSSIECIISADNITSKLIEKDEYGDPVEYHSILNKNLRSFMENLR